MAARALRKIIRNLIIVINSVVALLFLVGCLVPYLNPATWWFMGFFGLMLPYLAIILLFFIFFWLVVRPKYFWIPLVTLLIGYKQLSVLFAVNKHETFSDKKDSARIRVINWNIRSLEGLSNKADIKKIDRATIPSVIIDQNADIVCLQEFNTSSIQDNIAPIAAKFPYYFFSKDFTRSSPQGYKAGSIIFSKYPIVDSGKVRYPGEQGESLIYADVLKAGKILRVFTTHLQSFRFKREDYEGMKKVAKNEDPAASKTIFQKMKTAFTIRGEQARIVRDALDNSPHPSIITGDFNDVPNSYTYFHIRGDWQDVFLASSLGIGRTYLALAPTLRIDYILPDKNFNIHQFDMMDEGLSDHLMLVTDVSLKQ
ncbi:endonuclease/exonuclease/phosphatase family protein [Aridibaculum aurantiacum]|uniref:endonuclease/exonuclease/phosphatase family protein n=1 Tax=Aridibaculum aurantiacum TaxID=2810307 RepID=UPI001A971144|nr:endonuclease/exonuclease/phosphatase family protein [Aridibaculum aurantiacum]